MLVLNNTLQVLQNLAVPVPLRHWTAVVKPLVLGSRWYFSLGNPLDSATSILMRCLVSVKRVPSQYSRNCARQKQKKPQGYLEISKEIQQHTGNLSMINIHVHTLQLSHLFTKY